MFRSIRVVGMNALSGRRQVQSHVIRKSTLFPLERTRPLSSKAPPPPSVPPPGERAHTEEPKTMVIQQQLCLPVMAGTVDSNAVALEQPKKDASSFTSAYIHPLSQIVLLHFQTSCHDWIRSKRLDQSLVLHRDGTFTLERPAEHQLSGDSSSSSSALRIWTFYDAEERRHLLMVSMNQVRYQFLLQDNQLSAWQGFKRRSLPERIQETLRDLMDAIDELEG